MGGAKKIEMKARNQTSSVWGLASNLLNLFRCPKSVIMGTVLSVKIVLLFCAYGLFHLIFDHV